MDLTPVTLRGKHVLLSPLAPEDHAGLCAAGLFPPLWQWMTSRVSTPEEMRTYINLALQLQKEKTALPFTIRRPRGKIIGCTRFANIEPTHRRVEIGWTWITPAWQRTAVNTEAKLLLMQHAFEVLGCVRVELKADALNEKSRQAIRRLGAQEEGLLRQHMIVEGGRVRDTVYYSVLEGEWADVKQNLQRKLKRDQR